MTKNIILGIALIAGLGMIFIGARFLLAAETAEAGYGIHFNEQGDYSFHYIKGIRDVFSGILICLFAITRQTKALAAVLLVGTIIPLADMLIVLGKSYNSIGQAMPHISAVIICFICGILMVFQRDKLKA